MCQFAKQYPIKVLKRLAAADIEVECPTVEKVVAVVRLLNEFEFAQEPLAQIQSGDSLGDSLEINNLENLHTIACLLTCHAYPYFIIQPFNKMCFT